MKDKTSAVDGTPSDEARFLERLRQHPELKARFQSILDVAQAADGPIQTADAVEERVIVELRQLGHATMNQWAAQAEQRLAEETRAADTTVRSRKKNADVVVCVRVGERAGSGLAQPAPELSAPAAGAVGSQFGRPVAAAGSSVDGLWQRTFLCPGSAERAGTLWL